jgi:hypothetical protein
MILDATAPHTRVDNFVIDDYVDKIDICGLGIYTVIKRHYNWLTGQCTPSYNRLAQLCNLSRRTVIRYVKRLKEAGLIDPQMRFTDEGQTSNQYEFYQPKRPKKPALKPAQTSTPAQTDTTAHMGKPPSDPGVTPPVTEVSPEQVFSEQEREKKEIAKTMPPKTEKAEKPVSTTKKQKNCPHPFAEVVVLSDGITICNHCYDLLKLPDAQAA